MEARNAGEYANGSIGPARRTFRGTDPEDDPAVSDGSQKTSGDQCCLPIRIQDGARSIGGAPALHRRFHQSAEGRSGSSRGEANRFHLPRSWRRSILQLCGAGARRFSCNPESQGLPSRTSHGLGDSPRGTHSHHRIKTLPISLNHSRWIRAENVGGITCCRSTHVETPQSPSEQCRVSCGALDGSHPSAGNYARRLSAGHPLTLVAPHISDRWWG